MRTLATLCVTSGMLCLPVAPAVAHPQPAGVIVSVVDPHGLAVAGASIDVRTARGRNVLTTDTSGSVRVTPEFPLDLEVRAPGFERAALRLEAPPPAGVTVRLSPATVRATVDVVVRDDAAAATAPAALAVDRTAARTVFDAIDDVVPGVSVTRRGVMGYGISTNGTGGVTIRGIGGQPNTGVLVVVDGRPEMQSLMGHPLPDAYSLSDAQAVSVTLGPASVLYGSNAMGGVIDIQTRQPRSGLSGRLSGSIGSFLTGQQRLAIGGANDRAFFSATAGLDHTRGDRPRSAYRGATATLSAGTSLSTSWRATVHGNVTDFRVEDPGPARAPLPSSEAVVDRGGLSLTLDHATNRSWGYARAYATFGHHVITDGFRSVDDRAGLRLHEHIAAGSRTVIEVGADVSRSGGRARNVLTSLDYGSHRRAETAVFARAEHRLTAGIGLSAGMRYDRDSLTGGIAVPELGVAVRLAEGATLSASASRGFRNPTIRELYLFPAPNPALKPERLWNYQASLQVRPHASLSAGLTAYYADVDDLIVTLGRFPNLVLRNEGRALNRGLEATVRWRLSPLVECSGGYAYLRSTNLAPLVPAHKLTYAVDAQFARLALRVGGMTVGQRWADTSKTATLSGYTTLSLKATVPVTRRLSVFTLVDNLAGRAYEVVPGYPMPGRNVMGGMTLAF